MVGKFIENHELSTKEDITSYTASCFNCTSIALEPPWQHQASAEQLEGKKENNFMNSCCGLPRSEPPFINRQWNNITLDMCRSSILAYCFILTHKVRHPLVWLHIIPFSPHGLVYRFHFKWYFAILTYPWPLTWLPRSSLLNNPIRIQYMYRYRWTHPLLKIATLAFF